MQLERGSGTIGYKDSGETYNQLLDYSKLQCNAIPDWRSFIISGYCKLCYPYLT